MRHILFPINLEAVIRRCFILKLLLKFWKFYCKTPVSHLIFNKIAGVSPATYSKESLAWEFSCQFCEIFKNTYCVEHLRAVASANSMS